MKRKVIIVGAGIAGINAAIILAKAGIEVRLFEAKKILVVDVSLLLIIQQGT